MLSYLHIYCNKGFCNDIILFLQTLNVTATNILSLFEFLTTELDWKFILILN